MRLLNSFFLRLLILSFSLISFPIASWAVVDPTVRTKGVAEPPFLAYGAKPNLLMAVDNSASMWDMAYVANRQPTKIATVTITTAADSVTSVAIKDGGAGYTDGDTLFISGGDGGAEVKITVGDGVVTAVDLTGATGGTGYVDGTESLVAIDEGRCVDEDYISASIYAGYFETDAASWYSYNSTSGQFEKKTEADALNDCNDASGKMYYRNDVCVTINTVQQNGAVDTIPRDPDDPIDFFEVTAFAGKGNFLNWATASKFDIQKQILTGGKYDDLGDTDDATGHLVLESRGCSGRRFIKEIVIFSGVLSPTPYTLSLAIRQPEDDEKADANDDTTRIEIFNISAVGGLDTSACEEVLTKLEDDTFTPGDKTLITECIWGPSGAPKNTLVASSNSAYNNSVHFCWKLDSLRDGDTTNINSDVSEVLNACKGIYDEGVLPGSLNSDDSGYPCYGTYDSTKKAPYDSAVQGFLGRCWAQDPLAPGCKQVKCTEHVPLVSPQATNKPYHDPFCGGDGYVYKCDGTFSTTNNTCDGTIIPLTVDGTGAECYTAPTTTSDWIWTPETPSVTPVTPAGDVHCGFNALVDYCGSLDLPDVIDPTDMFSLEQDSDFVSMPAILIESAAMSQLGDPIAVMKGRIAVATPPFGILQDNATTMRIGAMVFNENGSDTECNDNDKIDCPAANKDGGYVMTYIDSGATHNADLVTGINGIKARTWTPLAETMYNAIGYYSNNDGLRLNTSDFDITTDPVEAWCQSNNVLIISEGASSTDLNSAIETLLAGAATPDGDGDPASCGELSGSSRLDDLALYAQKDLFGDQDPDLETPNNRSIKTFVVVAGTLRVIGTDECSPDVLMDNTATQGGTTLYQASDPAELKKNLLEVFAEIKAGASAGSAASVISSSRSGEGAAYQAVFWPDLITVGDASITWAGEVHGLLIDSWGRMVADVDHNRVLNQGPGLTDDKRVTIFYNVEKRKSMACYDEVVDGVCPADMQKDLNEVDYLWSAGNWLASISPVKDELASHSPTMKSAIYENRYSFEADTDPTDAINVNYISSDRKRTIFTWNDLNNDGLVTNDEILDFVDRKPEGTSPSTDWTSHKVAGTRGSLLNDFNVSTNDELNQLVRWIRGADSAGLRSRNIPAASLNAVDVDIPPDGAKDNVTWRLGDVIHSTPTAVSSPAEGFHLLYRDESFVQFYAQYKNRRHMIYFGGNDGMLHAVNGGFYDVGLKKFCRTDNCDESDLSGVPELGAEMWAYIPYNLQPHLESLTALDYQHKYYVDQMPRIFDVRIFPADDDHPGGWGTILVGGMRLGGAKVPAADLNGLSGTDLREFTSAYFVMDITNPDKPPRLMTELTRTIGAGEVDLGYTTPMPTMVIMKDSAADGFPDTDSAADYSWYLVFGNGPRGANALDGHSDQPPRISVLPLAWLNKTSTDPFRIQVTAPTTVSKEGGTFLTPDLTPLDTTDPPRNGFVSDLVTVDFELLSDYRSDAVYFGTVEEGNRGAMYRLVTREKDANGDQTDTLPSQWGGLLASDSKANPNLLIDTNQPITAAASVGADPQGNYWIYFGTGRFFSIADKSDTSQQTYYGIKEPMNCNVNAAGNSDRRFTWETVEKAGTSPSDPGGQGLANVTDIQVAVATSPGLAALSCRDGGTGCLTDIGLAAGDTLDDLIDLIVGEGCEDPPSINHTGTGFDGWSRNFDVAGLRPGERNLGQATLLGGLLTFTTYQPYTDPCRSEGLGYLYGVYYQTGTAWSKPVFGLLDNDNSVDNIGLGRGLVTTPNLFVGSSEDGNDGVKVFLQTSTGEIKGIVQGNLPYSGYKTGKISWRKGCQ